VKKLVGILGHTGAAQQRLFQLLAAVFDFRIEERRGEDLGGLDAVIVLDQAVQNVPEQLSSYSVWCDSKKTKFSGSHTVQFSNSSKLGPGFRGQLHITKEAAEANALEEQPAHEVLARIEGQPVWDVFEDRDIHRYRVSIPLPEMAPDQHLIEFLSGELFLKLLPLLHFLRSTMQTESWTLPPLRASVIIDDPNLHSVKYGRIDYRRLVERAQEQNFHIAMATVPLDAWAVSPAAAKLFREHRRWLSLMIHGNNHTHAELAQIIPQQQRLTIIAEALRRIEELERRSGAKVLRIMVPPHGACSEEFMMSMLRFGFDACSANVGPWLWRTHKSSDRPPSAGLQVSDIMAGGLPIISRYHFNSPTCPAKTAIAVFLGQAIVPYGHHGDLKESGDDSLAKSVAQINALGDVRWMNLQEILETNFASRVDGSSMRIRVFSRKVKLKVPEGIRQLVVEAPDFSRNVVRAIRASQGEARTQVRPIGEPIVVEAGTEAEIQLEPAYLLDHRVRSGTAAVRFGLRRIAVELRDRLTP